MVCVRQRRSGPFDRGGAVAGGLEAKLPDMIREPLELNEHLLVDKSRLEGPHSFRLVALDETVRAIAA